MAEDASCVVLAIATAIRLERSTPGDGERNDHDEERAPDIVEAAGGMTNSKRIAALTSKIQKTGYLPAFMPNFDVYRTRQKPRTGRRF